MPAVCTCSLSRTSFAMAGAGGRRRAGAGDSLRHGMNRGHRGWDKGGSYAAQSPF